MLKIDDYLADLEHRMDTDAEEYLLGEWRKFNEGIFRDGGINFEPQRHPAAPSTLTWPDICVNAAIRDESFELMMLRELRGVNNLISGPCGNIPMMRANYGTPILPSLFGCEVVLLEDKLDTLPAALSLSRGPEGEDKLKWILDQGIPDISGGMGGRVFACSEYFKEKLSHYPKLNRYCRIYHPDMQGVLDIAEVVYGTDIFLTIYDAPELVTQFFGLITGLYIRFADRFFSIVKPDGDYNFHYGWMHKGKIRMSLDSCVNFSGDMYRQYILPYDAKLLNHYGGIIHSCGKVDHFVPILPEAGEGYHGLNISQPELNDMEKIYDGTIRRDIVMFGLKREVASKVPSRKGLLHSR